jgi:cell wall-associated protease
MNNKLFLGIGVALILASCSTNSLHKVAVPINNSTAINIPAKKGIMTEEEIRMWPHSDLTLDSVPGLSIEKAYDFLADKEGTTVVVAVIDSGIDINHEDLKDNLWKNSGEIAGNGIDDDKNGYIDDIHGWNFFGGEEGKSTPEQLEVTRIYKKLSVKYADINELDLSKREKEEYAYYKQAAVDFNKGYKKASSNLTYFETAKKAIVEIGAADKNQLKKYDGTIHHYRSSVNIQYNLDFDGRSVTGDDAYDIKDVDYGNAYVIGSLEDEMHGTHVAGISLALRDNGTGMNGVAHNAKLMTVRAVPNGDEYDKDIALALRYAVDNGAKVVNMSFGKSYSTNPEWVYDAIKYAEKHDVLLVHAAGNDGKNIDKYDNYPNDAPDRINEIADNMITVGSITKSYDKKVVSNFSNYGKLNVDIFAPGSEIYSTIPNNEYKSIQGTSMAAPEVAGVAALVRSYYPQLSASQVKWVIINSASKIGFDVLLPKGNGTEVAFSELSVSGGVLNAYNALVLADEMVNGKN